MTEKWYSPAQLAKMNLPGLPGERAIQIKAKAEDWPKQKGGQGGGWVYPVSSLPAQAQKALMAKTLKDGGALPAVKAAPIQTAPADLKDYQRQTWEARLAILSELDTLVLDGFSQGKAIDALVSLAKSGELRAELSDLIPLANARSGNKGGKGGRTLSRATLYNWLKERAERGTTALAPQAQAEAPIPAWAGDLMDLYARPTKPSLSWAVAQLAKSMPDDVPSYDQARRFLAKLDNISRNAGRMGPRALKSYRAYVARDTSQLWPGAVYVADGHCFDAEVSHPRHGRPFRPEITTVIDVFTRRIVGWSIGLSENKWDVTAAAVKAFTSATVCDIWYADNGPGFNNALWDDALTGLVARLSITKKNSLPYNSQARGVIERLHKTVWVAGAKALPTYMGADMDDEARQKAFKTTRRDIKQAGRSRLLLSWPDFVRFCTDLFEAYNTEHHHSELPRISCPRTGKRRHMTPTEMWDAAVAQGWTPDVVAEDEAVDLFRPYEKRQTRRALVELFGNSYFAPALEAFHGEDVLVGYDTTDASKVWVRALDGRFIAVAKFEGHKTSFFPVTVAQQAAEKRAAGRLARLDVKRGEAMAELSPAALLDHAAPTIPYAAEDLAEAGALIEAMAQPAAEPVTYGADGRPLFASDVEWVLWLIENPERVTSQDREGLRNAMQSPSFRLELEMNGVAATALSKLVNTKSEAA